MRESELLLQYFENHQEEFVHLLKTVVEYETPTYGRKELKYQCGQFLFDLFESIGFQLEKIDRQDAGYHIHGTYGSGDAPPVFLLGHYDTVFDEGSLENMPFFIADGKAHGPGIFDMKGGVLAFYMCMKAIQELKLPLKNRIELFINADEEAGSITSQKLIEDIARRCKACIVTEPGFTERGSLKNERFGRAIYRIEAQGVAGHAGNHPENASSPITELAKQWELLEKENRYDEGLTISAVSIHSGTAGPTAKIPETAYMYLDIRFRYQAQYEYITKLLTNLKPVLSPMKLLVEGGVEKQPLEPNAANTRLVDLAREIWQEIGVELVPKPVGGGSDGNFTSAVGCPTIDGVGMSGEFLHNPKEYVILEDIPYRLVLVAELVMRL